MPHIVVEYSENLVEPIKANNLLKELYSNVVNSDLFSPDAVKARGIVFTDYVLPESASSFCHITCSILSGRTEEQRLGLSESLFACAKENLAEDVKVSVNIHEMDKAIYKK